MDNIFYNVDDLLNISDEELGGAIEGNHAGDWSIPLEVGSLFSVNGFYDIDWIKDFIEGEQKEKTSADLQHKKDEEQCPESTSQNAISSDLSSDLDNRSCTVKNLILCSRMTIQRKPRSKRSKTTVSKWVSKPISTIGSESCLFDNAAAWRQSDNLGSEQGKKKEVNDARICLHCGVNKTPQWRCGPLGPKTLCNACGVRYKSGGLLPEYRPAASPSFSPDKHSNSSKVVLEMRSRKNMKGD
ncbi:GATA transcription factor 9-like [Cryptomeria japonica]|uniref:GATA transcription factor 9-like n=1 Tax=Cryptomeria japonica TaxID=3369 RepID=UPI0027DA0DB8|nr:GATA transcription factor 9-like [Cryptomeria japonica]